MRSFAQLGFFVALAVAFIMAILPQPPALPGEPSDKIQHVLAFVTLGALAAAAFPALSIGRIVIGLAIFGGTIELVQAIPMLNRDSELLDFVADVVAALVATVATRKLIGLSSRE